MTDRQLGQEEGFGPAESGVGTSGTWVRFALILGVIAVPLFFLFRAGARKVGDSVAVAGMLTWGHEVRSFRPCGDDRELWVVAEPPILNRLGEELELLAAETPTEPYAPVYAVLTGKEVEGEGSAFAADYDGRFQVLVIDRLAPASLSRCPES